MKNNVLDLAIAVTLVAALSSSSIILGKSYAQSESAGSNVGQSEKLDIDPDVESESSKMVSPQSTSQNRFCLEGTGGFGRTCIPCDPTKPTPGMNTNCSIFRDGGVMSQEDIVSKEVGIIKISPEFLITGLKVLEKEGEIPVGTGKAFDSLRKGDLRPLAQLCIAASKDPTSNIKAAQCTTLQGDKPGTGTAQFGPFVAGVVAGWAISKGLDALWDKINEDTPDKEIYCRPFQGYEDTGVSYCGP